MVGTGVCFTISTFLFQNFHKTLDKNIYPCHKSFIDEGGKPTDPGRSLVPSKVTSQFRTVVGEAQISRRAVSSLPLGLPRPLSPLEVKLRESEDSVG